MEQSVKDDIRQLAIIAENNRSVLGDEFKKISEPQKKDHHIDDREKYF